jgi:hypothetical protein
VRLFGAMMSDRVSRLCRVIAHACLIVLIR